MLPKSFVPMGRVTYFIPPTQIELKSRGDLEKETKNKQTKNEGEWTVKVEIRERKKNPGSGRSMCGYTTLARTAAT